MQGHRNEKQAAQQPSDIQQLIEESRKAIERVRLLVQWRTLESIRGSSRK
jgi:hypothetical protein